MNKSHFIKHEQCPNCAREGKDNDKNNLAYYSDGHKYCFSCGYSYHDNLFSIKNKHIDSIVSKEETMTVRLPEDIDINYPQMCLDWLGRYDLTKENLLEYNSLWSESAQRLIFPVFRENGCIFYTGRYFGKESKCKWQAIGKKENFINLLYGNDICVVAEDIISAIKINIAGYSSIPLYGTALLNRLNKLPNNKKYFLWLDPDKTKESIFFCRVAVGHGFDIKPIVSRFDPKEHSYDYIKKALK